MKNGQNGKMKKGEKMNNLLNKKVERETIRIEKKAKRIAKKMKLAAILIGSILAIGVVFFLFYQVSKWYDENRVIFQNPIILQAPIKIERRDTPKKQKTRKEGAVKSNISAYPQGFEEAYDLVWFKESGRGGNKTGLNGFCISKGGINEIGYSPADKYCFDNPKEQKETFMLWLSNRLNKVKMPYCETINQCILVYSAGNYGLE